MKILKTIIVSGAVLCFVGAGYEASGQSNSGKDNNAKQTKAQSPSGELSELITNLRAKKLSAQELRDMRNVLRTSRPKTRADVRTLITAAQDDEIRDVVLFAVKSIDSTSPEEVAREIVEQVDANDDTNELKILRAVLDVNVANRLSGAKERIRARLSREPKTIIRKKADKESLWQNNWGKGKRIGRVQVLAEALSKLEGAGAIDTLFSLDEVMSSGRAGLIIAPLGVTALNRAIKDFPNESGLRQEGCLDIIAFSTSSEAVPVLEQLAKSENFKLRHAAVQALVRTNSQNTDRILEEMRKDANQEIRKFAEDSLHRRHPERYKQDFIDALSGRGPISCAAALGVLAESPISGTEEALEQFIRLDEKQNRHNPTLRSFAAKSIWKLNGRKIEYDRGLATYEKYPWEK